jgi:flagellar biosynthetic protein FliQ
MNADSIYELIKTSLAAGLILIAPMALVALVVGTVVSVLQTITSVQEPSLAFVPKLLAASAALWLAAPWMLEKMGNLMTLYFQRAGNILR